MENPDASKFRTKGLRSADQLDILFRDVAATGEGSWAPSMGFIPSEDRLCDSVDGKNDESSIAKVIKMLRGIPEIESGSELYMKAVRLFLKKENKETFVALKDHDLQIMFLEQA
ncbi:hypothetical protein Dsin_021488 [Dipteronia sinensis]|uniref:Uncharacterized protein n=1 Tax=Dipteronia sinensis TaxID=43782 RepID=A0AAD9ZZM7_9ROSI|nr:hypothetical protein Dsin_021488 [Dipteronia sinensis]